MANSEQSRHHLHDRLAEALGRENATLMEHLAPPGWAEVATTRHLGALVARVNGLLDAPERRMRAEVHEAITHALTSPTRTILFGLGGSNLTVVALLVGALGLR